MSSIDDTKGIEAILIIEVIGKPPEHLVETLEEIVKKIDGEAGIKVIGKKINEPVLMKDQKEFYTTFAEVEIEAEEIGHLVRVMFTYMPAHVEIVSPEIIAVNNNTWSEILSELVRKLHGYDEVARIIEMEKKVLENKLKALMPKEDKKVEKDSGEEKKLSS